MQFKLYTDVNEFYSDTYDVLMRLEAQNMIPLSNIVIGRGKDKTDWRDPVSSLWQLFRMQTVYSLPP